MANVAAVAGASLGDDAELELPQGQRGPRARAAGPARRDLRARRPQPVPVDGRHGRRDRAGGRGRGDRRLRPGRPRRRSSAPARCCGVDEVYAMGGAHAVAALAYGTRDDPARRRHRRARARSTCRRPSAWSSGDVGIDGFLGPSDLLVLAVRRRRPGARRRSTCWPRPSTATGTLVALVADDAALLDARRRRGWPSASRHRRRRPALRRRSRRSSEGCAVADGLRARAPRAGRRRRRGAARRGVRAAGCVFVGAARSRSATTSPARTTRCPPAAPRASPRRCRRGRSAAAWPRSTIGDAAGALAARGRADRARRGLRDARRIDGSPCRENGAP